MQYEGKFFYSSEDMPDEEFTHLAKTFNSLTSTGDKVAFICNTFPSSLDGLLSIRTRNIKGTEFLFGFSFEFKHDAEKVANIAITMLSNEWLHSSIAEVQKRISIETNPDNKKILIEEEIKHIQKEVSKNSFFEHGYISERRKLPPFKFNSYGHFVDNLPNDELNLAVIFFTIEGVKKSLLEKKLLSYLDILKTGKALPFEENYTDLIFRGNSMHGGRGGTDSIIIHQALLIGERGNNEIEKVIQPTVEIERYSHKELKKICTPGSYGKIIDFFIEKQYISISSGIIIAKSTTKKMFAAYMKYFFQEGLFKVSKLPDSIIINIAKSDFKFEISERTIQDAKASLIDKGFIPSFLRPQNPQSSPQ